MDTYEQSRPTHQYSQGRPSGMEAQHSFQSPHLLSGEALELPLFLHRPGAVHMHLPCEATRGEL